jgi:hypothetical protein
MQRLAVPEFGGYDGGYDENVASNFDPHLKLTVVHTTTEGTLSALKLANGLTKDLSAQIRLVAPEVVPFRLPLEHPLISTEFLRKRETRLVEESGLDECTVSIEICLCREPKKALKEYLTPGSLIIIGGKARWWRAEQRCAKWLRRIGHQVLFVDVKQSKSMFLKPLQLIRKHEPCKHDLLR